MSISLYKPTAVKVAVDQEKLDRKFMAFLRQNGIEATKKALKNGEVRYHMKSPKKMIIISHQWTKIAISDKDAAENGMDDLEGVKKFFARYSVGQDKKPKEIKIEDRPIYD